MANRRTVENLLQANSPEFNEDSINNVVASVASKYEKEHLIIEEVNGNNELAVGEKVNESFVLQNNLNIGTKNF